MPKGVIPLHVTHRRAPMPPTPQHGVQDGRWQPSPTAPSGRARRPPQLPSGRWVWVPSSPEADRCQTCSPVPHRSAPTLPPYKSVLRSRRLAVSSSAGSLGQSPLNVSTQQPLAGGGEGGRVAWADRTSSPPRLPADQQWHAGEDESRRGYSFRKQLGWDEDPTDVIHGMWTCCRSTDVNAPGCISLAAHSTAEAMCTQCASWLPRRRDGSWLNEVCTRHACEQPSWRKFHGVYWPCCFRPNRQSDESGLGLAHTKWADRPFEDWMQRRRAGMSTHAWETYCMRAVLRDRVVDPCFGCKQGPHKLRKTLPPWMRQLMGLRAGKPAAGHLAELLDRIAGTQPDPSDPWRRRIGSSSVEVVVEDVVWDLGISPDLAAPDARQLSRAYHFPYRSVEILSSSSPEVLRLKLDTARAHLSPQAAAHRINNTSDEALSAQLYIAVRLTAEPTIEWSQRMEHRVDGFFRVMGQHVLSLADFWSGLEALMHDDFSLELQLDTHTCKQLKLPRGSRVRESVIGERKPADGQLPLSAPTGPFTTKGQLCHALAGVLGGSRDVCTHCLRVVDKAACVASPPPTESTAPAAADARSAKGSPRAEACPQEKGPQDGCCFHTGVFDTRRSVRQLGATTKPTQHPAPGDVIFQLVRHFDLASIATPTDALLLLRAAHSLTPDALLLLLRTAKPSP